MAEPGERLDCVERRRHQLAEVLMAGAYIPRVFVNDALDNPAIVALLRELVREGREPSPLYANDIRGAITDLNFEEAHAAARKPGSVDGRTPGDATWRELARYHGLPCAVCGGVERYRANSQCVACSQRRNAERRRKAKGMADPEPEMADATT
jgi:hypothetical protein